MLQQQFVATYNIRSITTSALCCHHANFSILNSNNLEVSQMGATKSYFSTIIYDIFLEFSIFLMNFRKEKEKEKLQGE
jgi:hypothetical protein